jgi:hypothetical protein
MKFGPQNATTLEPRNTITTPANVTVHIGIHDIFIEGEYLTVHSKRISLLQEKIKKKKMDVSTLDESRTMPLGHMEEWRYSSTLLNLGTSCM